jgi:hypothetical protein
MNSMTAWPPDELDAVARADELAIVVAGRDGHVPAPTTIWVVRVGDHLYVRSFRGPSGGWYRRALRGGRGHIAAGGVERDVVLSDAHDVSSLDVDAAYRAKYGRSPYLAAMVEPSVADTTLRLTPADREAT